ncbi:MAG: ROK family protein [Actinomycetota bacterium]
MSAAAVFGVDIGGSGVKGAPVDPDTGRLLAERERFETPQPATPEAVARVVADLLLEFSWKGPVGVTVPAVVQRGVVRTAANIDPSWIGCDFAGLLAEDHGIEATVLNDADAAGVAEMRHGAGRDRRGTVVLATLGTGIGTAVFVDGVLVPNTELGHLQMHGDAAERYAAARVRKAEDLSWGEWAERLDEYVHELGKLLWPDLVILGGGVSRRAEKWLDKLTADIEVVPAELQNNAGIVGAAMAAVAAG